VATFYAGSIFSGSRPQAIFTQNGTTGLYLRDATGTAYKSWTIGTNDIVVGFAITPSTAVGGTTFTTPALVINESSSATFSSTIQTTGFGSPAPSGIGVEIDYFPGGSVGRINAYNRTTPSSLPLSLQSFGGNLLIGTTNDLGFKLQASGKIVSVNDSISSYSSGNGTTYGFYNNGGGFLLLENAGVGYFGNFALATGIYTATSDINKKKDFELSNLGLNEILNLKPTLYRMKTENETNKHLGFIAQEVKQFIPQAFVENKDFIGLDYQAITATLVKAIQELNDKLVRNNIN